MSMIQPAAPVFLMRDIEEVFDWQNILIYGDFGVGKTHLAATAVMVPEMCDVLYLSLEGGEKTLKTIKRICKQNNVDISRLKVVQVTTFKQYSYIYEFLKIHIQARDKNDLPTLRRLEAQISGIPNSSTLPDADLEKLIPNPMKFRTVITDSLTEAQKYCMYQLLGIDPLTQKIDAEPNKPEWGDWGGSREMIQFLVRRFRDLPINSIFICAQDIEQDAKKQIHYTPSLPGKLSNDIRGLVDTVAYIAPIPLDGGVLLRRVFLVGGLYGINDIAAKNRYGTNLKGQWVDNPTMQTFFDLDND